MPAVPDQGEGLHAETPGLPGGPAETGPTCTEATNQGNDLQIDVKTPYTYLSVLSTPPQGPAVQEEVWRVGGTSSREDLGGREDATDGRSSLHAALACLKDIEGFQTKFPKIHLLLFTCSAVHFHGLCSSVCTTRWTGI